MNKTCVITGGNSGIGLETARKLACNNYKLILAVRNEEKGKTARDEIARSTGNKNIEIIKLDLNSLESVRKSADMIISSGERLDVLINNAGIFSTNYRQTLDGFEAVYGVNYLAPFLFTNLLMDLIKHTGEEYGEARIINVSSYGYKNSKGLNLDNLMLDKSNFSSSQAYGDSKLSIIYFTLELSRRYKRNGVIAHSLSPGTVRTNLVRGENTNKLYFGIVGTLMKLPILTVSPSKGAETSYFLATSEEAVKYNGEYWEKKRIKKPILLENSLEIARQLWDVSRSYVGLV